MSRPPQSENALRQPRLAKLPVESDQSPADEYREIAQRWKNRMVLEGHSVAEKYVAGCLSLVCDLNVFPAGGNVDEIATVQNRRQFANDERFARLVFKAKVPDVLAMDFGNQEFVFVQNVESVKLPDGFPIPSSVRLYDIQDEVADPFGGLMFKSAIDGVFHFLPGIVNRKLRELSPLPSSSELNITGRIVQSGSQIVDRIPDNAHHPFRNAFERDDVEAIVASLRIVLDGDFVRVTSLESSKFLVKFTDVLFGPLDL